MQMGQGFRGNLRGFRTPEAPRMQPIQHPASVFSETARLRQVVVHNPGPEVDLMVPGMMEKLLFDDILYGDLARQEHAQFRQVLARVADEVLDIQDLFIEALQDEGVKLAFVEDLRRLVGLPDDTCNLLRDMAPADTARSVIGGLPWDDMPSHTHWEEEFDYRVRPIPNLLFMRDPASVIGDGYSVNSMATWAREREPLILSYVFRHHPRLRHHTEHDKWFDQVTPLIRGEIKAPVSMEGGDILVLSHKVLVVGCSERTQTDAIQLLAESLRAHRAEDDTSFDHLLMVLMPKKRSAMHLDTIFTRTSENECLVYPALFRGRQPGAAQRDQHRPAPPGIAHEHPPEPAEGIEGRGHRPAAHLLRRERFHPPAAGAVDGWRQRLLPSPRASSPAMAATSPPPRRWTGRATAPSRPGRSWPIRPWTCWTGGSTSSRSRPAS